MTPVQIDLGIKVARSLDKIIFKSKKFNMTDTVLIAGTPRAGTTWLMEILGTIPDYTYLFEPLNPIWYPESRELGFRSRKYLPSDTDWPEGEDYLRKIFTGGLVGFQSLYQITPKAITRLLLSNKLIVKSVRLNRLLPWIVKRFQLRRIFFIIRHPCAVVASQFKTGFCGYHNTFSPYANIFPTLEHVLDEASKIDSLKPGLLNKLKHIKTKEEILAAVWCLDNYVPLSLPKPQPWTIVTYEKLVKRGREEMTHLFNELGEKDIPQSAFQHLRIPSMLAPGRLAPGDDLEMILKAEEQLSKWKKFLSDKQIERILNVVSDFGIDFYTEYSES